MAFREAKVADVNALKREILLQVRSATGTDDAREAEIVAAVSKKTQRVESIVKVNVHGMEHEGLIVKKGERYTLWSDGEELLERLLEEQRRSG